MNHLRVPPIRDDGLQLDERRQFHKRFWAAERIAWAGFGVILLLALAGLTGGGGPLSSTTVATVAGEVTYPRVARWETSDELVITFARPADNHRLTLHDPFSSYYQIENIQPEPEQSSLAQNAAVLSFDADSGAPAVTTLHVRPLRPGVARFRVEVDGEQFDAVSVILP